MPNDFARASAGLADWLRGSVVFPFLLPIFFVLHVARYFYGTVPAIKALEIAGIYLALCWVIYFLFRRLIKGRLEQGVATLMSMGLLIYWVPVIRFIMGLLHLSDNFNYYPLALAIYLLTVFIICYAVRRLNEKAYSGLFYYLNALFVLFVAVEIGFIGFYAFNSIHKKPLITGNESEQSIDQQAKAGNNIYLLLFDEYASTPSLKENWGFDNSATDSFLKAKGFFVSEESRSNYCWTFFSMASLLEMNYFSNYRQPLNYYNARDAYECAAAIKNARVFHILDHAGYALKSYSIFDVADQPGRVEQDPAGSAASLLLHNSLYWSWITNYLPYIRHRAAIKRDPAYRYPPFYAQDDYNNQGVDAVIQQAMEASKPKFVYAHFMMPHNRYYYDSANQLMTMDKIKAIGPDEDLKYYRYGVQHTNNKLRQMVDTILKFDAQATIIVLGDHGYRQKIDAKDHPEYFRNMSALYFPDKDYASIPDSLTNVNVFRIVLNKVCGTHYPLLENKCYKILERAD